MLELIKELAAYEQMADKVVASEADVLNTLFGDNPKAEALLAEVDGEVAGFAVFFHNYSTFLCRYGLYIEDVYVREACRGAGLGRKFFQHICQIAVERNCDRVEWWCLDWNKPAIDFYLKLGAEPMVDWTVYRLQPEQFKAIAEG